MKVKTSKKIIGIPPVYFVSAIFLSLICYLIFPQFNLISYPSNLVGGIFLLLIGFYWIMKPHNNLEKHNSHSEKFSEKVLGAFNILCDRMNGGSPGSVALKKELKEYKEKGFIINRRKKDKKVEMERRE